MATKKKEFNFGELKAKYSTTTKYKPDVFLSCGDAFQEASGMPGPAMGHINMLLGHTNTGKTTALIAAAVDAQSKGILPIFLITEKKWSFEHCQLMGLDCTKDEKTGEWEGQFFYRDDFNYIEQVTDYINSILDDQEKGILPFDICFFWDSVGSVPCKMTWEGKGGKMHTAGVLAEKINMGINQRINNSRKENSKYTNGLVICNLPWVKLPENPLMGKPKMKPKGGEAIYQCATLVFRFGNEADAGISKIDATKNGRKINFATRTKVTVDKNHVNGLGYADSHIIVTPHGFIKNDKTDKTSIEEYKKSTADYWTGKLGDMDFNLEENEVKTKVDYSDED
jgi:hypothetical protein